LISVNLYVSQIIPISVRLINQINVYFKILIVVFFTVYYAIKVSFKAIFGRDKYFYRRNAVKWSERILDVFKVRVEVQGLEELEVGKTYILVANHSSLFDIPVLFTVFKNFNFIIVYKRELERIPIFGLSLKVSPFVSIDRSDARSAMKSIEETLAKMSENDCPIIFPEGTRSADGSLGSFKRGAFLLASMSLKPIVPVAISGSSKILPKGSFNVKANSIVNVRVFPPIENSKPLDRVGEKELMNKVFEQIKQGLIA